MRLTTSLMQNGNNSKLACSITVIDMSLSESVQSSLAEAEAALRNALSYAARQERPIVCNSISKLICEIERIESFDGILDKLEEFSK